MHYFANPLRFKKLSAFILPLAALVAAASLAAGLYGGLYLAPGDYLQGDAFRIIYVHVPAAWLSLFAYAAMAAFSFMFLVWKHPLADILARVSSPIGAGFTAIALLTGMLWGKPMWGTAWVWDARLTSVLILFFLYIGHIVLVRSFDDPMKGSFAGAVLALLGAINLPIIKFSVNWWNTLHQPASISRLDNPAIHSSMAWPLLLMALGYMAVYVLCLLMAARGEIAARKKQITNAERLARV